MLYAIVPENNKIYILYFDCFTNSFLFNLHLQVIESLKFLTSADFTMNTISDVKRNPADI